MELRQLKYFARAAVLLNFTKAADELYITQSTLSHQIKELEAALGAQLFDRVGKRVKLTEAGAILLEYAQKTIRMAEEGQQVLLDLGNLKTGRLIIGATYGLTELLIRSLAQFSQAFPDIQIQVVFGSTEDLLRKIHHYEIDCMLSFLATAQNEGRLDMVPLFSSSLSLIVHESHPWSGLKTVSLEAVSALPLALPSPGYSIRIFLDKILAGKAIDLKVRMETNDIHSLLELAATKQWTTILMNSSLFGFASLKAIPLEGKNMKREATIAFPKEVYRKKAVVSFFEVMREQCAIFR